MAFGHVNRSLREDDPYFAPMASPLAKQTLAAGGDTPMAAPAAPTPTPQVAAIPNAGIYAEQQALAQQAYEAAITQLDQQQASLYNRFGLGMVNGEFKVDPHNQFGEYQQMRRGQAEQLDEVEADTRGRGFQGQGLANQRSGATRFAHGLQNLGLTNSFLDAFRKIQDSRTSALFAKNRAMWESERDAARDAIQNEDFTPAAAPTTTKDQRETTAVDPTAATEAARAKLAKAYNPQAYVRGGAPANVARDTQLKGKGVFDAAYYRRMVR